MSAAAQKSRYVIDSYGNGSIDLRELKPDGTERPITFTGKPKCRHCGGRGFCGLISRPGVKEKSLDLCRCLKDQIKSQIK